MADPVPLPEDRAVTNEEQETSQETEPSTAYDAAPTITTDAHEALYAEAKKRRDRRRRRRARVAMRVLIRGGIGSLEPFEDLGVTIDASRDGLLVQTTRGGYWEDQIIEVLFPYHEQQIHVHPPQKARVRRCYLMPDHLHYALALEFQKVSPGDSDSAPATSYIPMHVRVLAVEPDERAAELLRDLLQSDGYQVVRVVSGKEALEVLRNETPDVLLSVVETGEISGLDLCAIVKKNVRLQHIPVILMTESGQPSEYLSCHQVGAVVCISKPCPPGKLQHAVRLVAPPPSMRSAYSGKANVSSFVRTS